MDEFKTALQNGNADESHSLANEYIISKSDITKDPVLSDSIGTHLYSSQGFGALHYAKGHAQRIANHYILNGIPAVIEEERDSNLTYFKAMVNCSHDLMTLLKFKSIDIEKDVINLLKNGLNPRVYYPFLPYNYEKTIGIDSFGNKK